MQYILYSAILCGGSFLQGAVGFGFGLFSTPFLVWGGASLSEAIIMVCVNSFFQSLLGALSMKKDIHWKEVLGWNVFRFLTVPLGIWLLFHIQSLSKSQVKQFIGIMLLIVLCIRVFVKVTPKEKLHAFWGVTAFSISGILNGMVGMGGPPIVLWLMAHTWSPREFRAFTQVTFALGIPYQMALLGLMSATPLWKEMGRSCLYAPLIMAAGMGGIWVGHHFSRERLQKLALILLFTTAILATGDPFLQKLF